MYSKKINQLATNLNPKSTDLIPIGDAETGQLKTTTFNNISGVSSDGVISGGIVTWTGTGLNFNISACVYYLNGIRYTSPFTTKTLAAADPTNPRIDVFAVNTSGQVVVIQGTPNANPIEPEGDTPTTLGLTNVTIAAGATTPSGVTRNLIYDENVESWIKSNNVSGSIDYNNTAFANTGTKSILVTMNPGYAYLSFYNASYALLNTSDFKSLSFAIRLNAAWTSNTILSLQFVEFLNGNGIYTTNKYQLSANNTVGFDRNLASEWQQITIPLDGSTIKFNKNTFNGIRISVENAGVTYRIDTIQLNSGIDNPTGGGTTATNSFGFVNGSTGTATASQATDTLTVVGTGLATTSATGKTLTIAVPTPIPTQTGNNGKFLTTDGTNVSWALPTDTGITSLNSQTGTTQTFATGTSGTDFGISSATNTHTFNLPTASATNRGALSSADWSTFNSKQDTLSLTTTGTSGAATLIGSTLNIPQYQAALTNPITGTGTQNYVSKFTTTGSTIGNSQIFDNGTSVGIGTATPLSTNLLQVEGIVASNTTKIYSAGTTLSSNVGAIQAGVSYTFGGNATVPNSIVTSSVLALSDINFTSTGTVTQNQAANIRAVSNIGSQWSFTGSTNGTITHLANTRLNSPYSASSATLSITNYYGLLIESSDQFTPFSITNKYGIYQYGANDKNYFEGDFQLNKLAGTGTRMVVADSSGVLSTQAIPSGNPGTVTSVSALTIGTSGTDITSTVADSTTTPVITLNVPTASATNRGALSSTDWTTFNNKFTLPSLTNGSVLFSNGTTIAQDNANFFWDDTNNRLGIGTSSPLVDLEVSKSVGASGSVAIRATNTSSTGATGLVIRNEVLEYGALEIFGSTYVGVPQRNLVSFTSSGSNGFNIILYNNSATAHFRITSTTGQTERFRLFGNTGNVLIQNGGTFTDAGYRLDVNGTARVSGSITANSFIPTSNTIPTNGMYLTASNTLGFSTNSNLNLILNQNGNLGLGITPSSWDSFTSFQFGEVGALGSNDFGTNLQTILTNNAYFNSSNFKYIRNGSSATYRLLDNTHEWYIATTGTADSNITMLSAMKITSSGRLLIGTTTESTFLLDVNGTGRYQDNLTVSKNQNAATAIQVINTTSGTNSESTISINSDNSSGRVQVGKYSTAKTAYKIVSGKDGYFYNAIAGDIAILNDFASGTIKFAAGASSTAQMTLTAAGRLLLGTTTENNSALLNVTSTSQGFLPPRMTTTQKNAIATPAAGLQVYDTTLNQMSYYNGTTWINF